MASGSIKVKLRPLRLAFLVEPNDAAAVVSAIQMSTFLWGGMLNPIIPYYRRLPVSWSDEPMSIRPTARAVVEGYVAAFDPDFIVKVGALESASLDFGHYAVIKATDILSKVKSEGLPSYGVGLFEILQHIAQTELKFVREDPMQFSIPKIGPKHEVFLSSIFGALPPALEDTFRKGFTTLPGLQRPACAVNNYWEFLGLRNTFFRRVGMIDIRPHRNRLNHSDCLFFLEAESIADVIDFWNLRSIGWDVIPICRESAREPGLQKFASEFVERNSWPFRYNPELFNHTVLLKSRGASDTDFEKFGRSLTLKPRTHPHEQKIIQQHWFPRMWDEWARDKDGVERSNIEVDEREYPVRKADESITFKSLLPKFAHRFGHRGPRCANEIDLRLWGDGELFAEVIPVGGQEVAHAAGGFGFMDWRCAETGLVHLARYDNFSTNVFIHSGQNVFAAWLREQKWKAQLSDKGHVAQQMFRHVRGEYGLGFIAIPGMVEFISSVSRKGVMRVDYVRAELSRIAKLEKLRHYDTDGLIRGLLANKMVQLGIELQCPHCRQHSWFSITEADYMLECRKCLENFEFPSERPNKIAWAYRAMGPFSLPNHAYGCLAVLLTFRFFKRQLDGATTPMLSFSAKKDDTEIEVDLGLFFRQSKYQLCRTELVLAECKTFNDFTTKDAQRMKALSLEFPGAVLVFATLKKELTEKEKRLLRPVVNRGRKYWKNERPYNPVLILTGNELLADRHPRQVWRDLSGIHARHGNYQQDRNELTQLADATQQIYLGLAPWPVWLRSRSRRKHLTSATPPTPAAPPVDAPDQNESLVSPFSVRMQRVPFLPHLIP